jgi:hypothetical protein
VPTLTDGSGSVQPIGERRQRQEQRRIRLAGDDAAERSRAAAMLERKPGERTVDLPQILEGRGKLRRRRPDIERRRAVGPGSDQIAVGMDLGALADHHHQASGDIAIEFKPGIAIAVIPQVLDIMVALNKPDIARVGGHPLQDILVLVRVRNRVIGQTGKRLA